MPRGESPYLSLASLAARKLQARGAFLYIDEGMHGDGWCAWAPPQVAARLPEFLANAADEFLPAGTQRESSRLIAPNFTPLHLGVYRDAAQAACMAANAKWAFILVLEGRYGTDWSVFAPPELNLLMASELLHGFAHDLKGEEPLLRGEASLQ